jgi:hypothetical protein
MQAVHKGRWLVERPFAIRLRSGLRSLGRQRAVAQAVGNQLADARSVIGDPPRIPGFDFSGEGDADRPEFK